MKSLIVLALCVLPVLVVISAFRISHNTRKEISDSTLPKAEQKFLRQAADARMMDWAEGNLAIDRGTNPAIKKYGETMLKDQDAIMAELKTLAASKKLVLPEALSKEKADGLDDLKEETGADFDKKFIKMMIIDHRRDVKDFKRAVKSDDADIRAFAVKYLPLIEAHLTAAKELKSNR